MEKYKCENCGDDTSPCSSFFNYGGDILCHDCYSLAINPCKKSDLMEPLKKHATLWFALDDSSDEATFRRAANADNAFSALWEVSQYLRELDRYSEEEMHSIDKIRSRFHEILGEENVDLDDYI